ncbi:hypothetical protein BDN67DRAFT_1015575 [Paxillus ammoniavirescens]|nr:hypothetical protein BDN67DRAFT_1015575 [Paxillus ammoniavirescens]
MRPTPLTHPNVRWWKRSQFDGFIFSPEGAVARLGSVLYLETEDGEPVSDESLKAIRQTLCGAWTKLANQGKKAIKDEDDKSSTLSGRKQKGSNSLPKTSGKCFKGKKLEEHSATPSESPPALGHVMPNNSASELQDQHIDDLVPTPNSLPPHSENIQVLTLPDKEGLAQSPSPVPFKFPFKDMSLANNLSMDHSPTSGSVSKDEQPHTNFPKGCESREGEALKKKKFFNPLSTEALEAANFTIPTISLPCVMVLPVDHVVPPTDPATTSKAIGVPKDINDDLTTQTREGEGTMAKKKM